MRWPHDDRQRGLRWIPRSPCASTEMLDDYHRESTTPFRASLSLRVGRLRHLRALLPDVCDRALGGNPLDLRLGVWVLGKKALEVALGQDQKLAIAKRDDVGRAPVAGQQSHLAEHFATPEADRAPRQHHLYRAGRDDERAVAAVTLA